MQVTGDKVVRVLPVGNGLVAAIGAMLMPRVMVAACMIGRTGVGIPARDAHCMFVMMIVMPVVHVTVVQIVGVTFVLNRGMAATGTMGMITVVALIVNLVIVGHGSCLLSGEVRVLEANEVRVCERTNIPLMLVPWYRNVSPASIPHRPARTSGP